MPRTRLKVPETGTRLRLISMPDDPYPVPPGSTGTVVGGSDLGEWIQIWVNWDDDRRSLSLTVPPDRYVIIPRGEAG